MPKKRPPPLIEPLPDYPILSGLSAGDVVLKRAGDYLRRIQTLHDHYELDIDPAIVASPVFLKVLSEHVPGFEPAGRKPGQPSRWKGIDGARLIAGVWFLEKTRQMTVWQACGFLVKNEFKDVKQTTLQSAFQDIPHKQGFLDFLDKADQDLGREVLIDALDSLLPASARK